MYTLYLPVLPPSLFALEVCQRHTAGLWTSSWCSESPQRSLDSFWDLRWALGRSSPGTHMLVGPAQKPAFTCCKLQLQACLRTAFTAVMSACLACLSGQDVRHDVTCTQMLGTHTYLAAAC